MEASVHTQEVELGLLARPEGGAKTVPGCVLIHDVWGLGDHARDLTRRLARDGFSVLGVDLYRRLERVEIRDPGAWMRDLSDPQILEDVGRSVEYLAELPGTAGHGVGVVGFCMGGTYALLSGCGGASGLERVAAVVPFYGLLSHEHGLLAAPGGPDPAKKPRSPLDAARALRCPLLGFFGGRDPYVPVADVERLREVTAATGQECEIEIYPDAGHAFVNDTRPDAYRETEARDAWGRMLTFFRRHL